MKTLETILDEYGGPLAEAQVLRWGIELCQILKDFHEAKPAPQVYGDLKPANVWLEDNGRLRLVYPQVVDSRPMPKMMVGTEGYAAPEQYKNTVTPAGDIYALGATLYHLLTGSDPRLEVPFTFHARPPRRYNPQISAFTEQVILKAVAFKPEERWPSAEAMQKELIKALLRLEIR